MTERSWHIGQRLSWTGSRRVAFVCPGCDRLIIPGASKSSGSSGAPADGVCPECHQPLAVGHLAVRQPEFYNAEQVRGWRRAALKGLLGAVYIAAGILLAWYLWHLGGSVQR